MIWLAGITEEADDKRRSPEQIRKTYRSNSKRLEEILHRLQVCRLNYAESG